MRILADGVGRRLTACGKVGDGVDHRHIRRSGLAVEAAERVGEQRTQLADPLGDGGFLRLHLDDARLHAVQFGLCGAAALLDLPVGLLVRLAQDLGGLPIGLLTAGGRIRIGLIAHGPRLVDQLIGFPLGLLTTLLKMGQQLVDLGGGLLLLVGDVGADLLHLGSDLAHGLGAVHLGLVLDLLRLGLGRVHDLRGLALRVRDQLGHLLAHVGQLLVRIGERRLDLVVVLALQPRDLLIGRLAQVGDLLGGLGAQVGDLAFLRGAFRSQTLEVLLAGVRQFHVNRLALFAHGLRRFGAQLGGVLLSRSRQALRLMPRVGQQRIGLGVGLAQHTLGVELGVVDQGLRLLLRGGLGGRGLTLGAFQQVGAGAFRRGEHLLRVGAQRGVARPLPGGLAAFLL